MQGLRTLPSLTCARCLRARASAFNGRRIEHVRNASDSVSPPSPIDHGTDQRVESASQQPSEGALSRRLAQMSEESLESGGKGARRAVEEAGFSEDLKRRLEEKIASANFKSEHASAFAQVSMPAGADKDSRDLAAARPWTGTETVEDASLRMLTDAYKPLRGSAPIRGPPSRIDTGRPKEKAKTGARLANARDRSSVYAVLKDPSMSEDERKKFRAELKQRFQPASRITPATVQGLASLANERIEDAIARGQFKNLPRGKKIERDYNASSPFINTTEYLLNKMIKQQEIVPPWIEKQQEVVSTANRFRGRLRADWKRHVSRVIASRGGSLEQQVQQAEAYANAESVDNPPRKKLEQINAIDSQGQLSQITLAGELKTTSAHGSEAEEDLESRIDIIEQIVNEDGTLKPPQEQITITAEEPQDMPLTSPSGQPPPRPTVPPFRDPQWEAVEGPYLRAAIKNLNDLNRSYNLMAPDLAKKPYFSLERELRSCFADVAPQVAAAIREKALAPMIKGVEVIGHKPGGVLDKFSMDRASQVFDERKPQYGFKQFWKDLFASKA